MTLERSNVQPSMEDSQTWLGNRAMRRKNRDPQAMARSSMVGEYNVMCGLLRDTVNEWNRPSNKYAGNLTRIVYQAKPFIYRWLEVRRSLPEFLQRAHFSNLETPFVSPQDLNRLDEQDFFSHKLAGVNFWGVSLKTGVSLTDIEQMPLPLGKEDIKKINSMFHDDRFSPENDQKVTIRVAMLFLASQKLARPEEKIVIPDSLHPLHQRLIAYFDYYKDLMINFDLGVLDEDRLFKSLAWHSPWLPQALGCYLPARFGITPSSAIKLFQTRAEISPIPTLFWKARPLPCLKFGAQDAFRRKALPQDIEQYQHYDAQMDQAATFMLTEYYKRQKFSDQDLIRADAEGEELVDQLTKLYFERLQDEINSDPKRYLEITMPERHLVSRVITASQNRQSLIFVLIFADGKTHLTLEIGKDQKRYGFPAKLVTDNPNFMILIIKDILSPILEVVKKRHPSVEPIRLSDSQKEKEQADQQISGAAPRQPQAAPIPPGEKVKPQPSRVLTPIVKILEGPEPANLVPIEPPRFVVFHSRDSVMEMLGMGKHVQQGDIDRIMRSIVEFEYGRGDFKKLKADRVEGEDIWEIRISNYRVLLSHIEGHFFALSKVGHRREIFNLRQRSRS